jgi:carboxyl-terminal processing protease
MNKKWLLLVFVASFYWQQSSGQAVEQATSIDDSQLNYYLYQSFAATDTTRRLRLNHIGMQTEILDGSYFVSTVLDGYPAHSAGIQRGDKLLSANGKPFHPVYSFNAEDASPSRFQPNPETYKLELARGNNNLTISVTPVFENLYDSLRSSSLSSVQEISAGNKVIGYVHLWSLSNSTNDLIQYQSILNSLSHCDGIIVDIRDSFGFITAEHFDAIFPSRTSYFQITENGISRDMRAHTATQNSDDYFGKPLAILQNKNTQAGMELFSYQLSKLQRVLTLGETTAGLIGDYTLREQNSGVEIMYLPAMDMLIDGIQLEGEGLEPQQAVEYPITRPSIGDPQYEAALAALMGIV